VKGQRRHGNFHVEAEKSDQDKSSTAAGKKAVLLDGDVARIRVGTKLSSFGLISNAT